MDRAVTVGTPILCPVGQGTGLNHAGVHVGLHPDPMPNAAGKRVTVTIVTGVGSLMAFLSLDDVACLQDELDRVVAELAGFVQAEPRP